MLSTINGPLEPLENRQDMYKSISTGEIYRNVELVLNAHSDNVEKIFIVSSHGNAAKIKIAISGIDNAEITANGLLAVNKSELHVQPYRNNYG